MKLEMEHISKHYGEGKGVPRREVLKDVSMTLHPGESMAIVGPSGSGKSTLLNLLGGLDKPSGGRVLFNGRDLWEMEERELAEFRNRHIGFVFQLHHLLPQLSLLENVMLPVVPLGDKVRMKSARGRAIELLGKVGLGDKIHQRPAEASVGECQRAAVVRALMNEPGFILADEPTGSLDQNSADNLGELLSSINQEHNIGVIVVTHAEKLARKMKHTWHLENGALTLPK